MIRPRKVDKPLVLYGKGKLGQLAGEIFTELKIPYTMLDKYDRYPPVGHGGALVAICVATEPYGQVTAPLITAGWTDVVPVWDIVEAYLETGILNGWFVGDLTQEDAAAIKWLSDEWVDGISFFHWLSFCAWHTDRTEFRVKKWAQIISAEALPSTLADIRERQKVIIWSDSHHSFWSSHGDSGTAYIHQEGKEMETLMANMKVFQNHRPKISCACYHSRDGLWKIPKFLMDNLPDYKWTFRLHAYMGQGAYIIGVPEEKI